MSGLTVKDLENLQSQHPDYQMELVGGEIIIMSPSGLESDGVLVDPRTRTMEIYRPNAEKMILQDGEILTIPELLPGWELPIYEVWAPEF